MPVSFPERANSLKQIVIVLPVIAGLSAILVWGSSDAPMPLKVRESILKQCLMSIREKIDQYASDEGAMPSSLDELIAKAYLREVPVDPLTGERDWVVEIGVGSIEGRTSRGIVDVHSNAPGKGSDGVQYRDY